MTTSEHKCITDREPRQGMDLFRDGFATVRKGNLPSGRHVDPRMNVSVIDLAKENSLLSEHET